MIAKINSNDTQNAIHLLTGIFGRNNFNLQPIGNSVISKSWRYSLNSKQFILRISPRITDFDKDKYCSEHFSSELIPIPKIIRIEKGENGLYYCISVKCNGEIIDNFEDKNIFNLIPLVLNLAYELRRIRISPEAKYGNFDGKGKAKFDTWKDYLTNTLAIDDFTRILYAKILKLIKYCPENKFLIHGDFGLNNILSDGSQITGIIDWGDAKYGDFLYDLAWICFWSSTIPYERLFLNYYAQKGVPIPYYKERLLCYTCFLGINVLKFLQETKDKKTYGWVLKKLEKSVLRI